MMKRRRRAEEAEEDTEKPERRGRSQNYDYEDVVKRIQPVSTLKKPLKASLYGRSGSGKTTLACSGPAPLLLDIKDEGTDSVSDVKGLKVLPVNSWDDLEQIYWYLKAGKHPYRTVIWDTVTQAQDLAIREVASSGKKKVDGAGGWGTLTKQQWGDVASMLKTWIVNFKDLPLHVFFIAQERIFNADEEALEDGQLAPEVGSRVMPSVGSTLNAAVDLIGNTFVKEKIIKKKRDGKITEEREVQYCLRIGPHAYYTTKVRKPKIVEVPGFLIDPTFDDLIDLKTGDK